MISESANELLKLRNSALVCRDGKRKGMWFCFSYFFWGEVLQVFFMTFVLAIPPLTMKNRPCELIWACALNRKNTVFTFLKSSLNHTIDIIYKSLLGKWNILLISRSWPVVGLSWHGQSHSFAMDWSNLDHIIELRALRNLINFHLTLRSAFSLQHWMSVPRLLGNGYNGKVLSVIISDWITYTAT